MASDDSVTRWLDLVQAGDSEAAQRLWERYFAQLVGLARKKLQNVARAASDEEDVALSAFNSFFHNAEQGRFPRLLDRDSLWRVLVVITARKAAHLIRDQGRQRRGGGSVPLPPRAGGDDGQLLDLILSREPAPDLAAQMAEQCQHLLNHLGNKELEQIALWRMEGYSVNEIAAKLECAPRSVKRKLQLIRNTWEKEEAQ
jgi:DNA-directed RNA polymerase specialized sigma24 family protein